MPSQALLDADRGSGFGAEGERPSPIHKKGSKVSGISLNIEAMFNTQHSQKYNRGVQRHIMQKNRREHVMQKANLSSAVNKRRENAGRAEAGAGPGGSVESSFVQRATRPAQAGAAQAGLRQRPTDGSDADTPPLLLQKGLLHRYQADLPRRQA